MSAADNKILKLLKAQPFLQGLPQHYFPMIADCSELKSFAEGNYLMQQKQPADYFYLILDGHVSIRANMPPRGVVPVETVGTHAALGWSWLVAPYKWHFDAVAMDKTDTILVHTPCILGKVENDKEFGFEIYKRFIEVVVDRLHGTQLQVMDVYAKPEQEAL